MIRGYSNDLCFKCLDWKQIFATSLNKKPCACSVQSSIISTDALHRSYPAQSEIIDVESLLSLVFESYGLLSLLNTKKLLKLEF